MAYRDQPLGELALSIPRASALFRKYDMDYCCGGKQTLARAAARKELDVEVIEAELAKLAEQPIEKDWRSAPLAEIIDHIIVRYHDRHREQLPELILQATKVERVHADKPSVPKGLTKYLTMLHEELSSHMMKEEQIDLAKLPVLSAAAPFKVGGRKNDPASYVEVEKGQLTFRNAADLYLYPNTLIVVKASGKEVKEWLECSAGQFNQIDPNSTKPQSLINWDGFRTYNFDVIDGVNYQIDVTQPARYDGECQMINANAERIKNLTFNGKPIDPNAMFLVATNNYRAYGGKFAGTGDSHIAFASPDENRSVLAAWIADESKRAGEIHPAADNNWRLAPIAGDKKLDIRFETSPSDKAAAFIKEKGQYPMNKVATDDIGFAIYQVDLSK